jgi:fatty acid desaturase
LLTPSVEGAGKVSKSVAAAATFWLALAKVRCGVPSWLMAAVMALARVRALVKSMVVAHSVPCVALCHCSSIS